MKVLLTGVSGFLGSHLFEKLNHEHTVVGTSRRDTKIDIKSLIHMNISSSSDWSMALFDITCVVHCAALAHENGCNEQSFENFREVNYLGTVNLAKQAASLGVNRFIYISSIGVNGSFTSNPFKFSDVPNPQDPYAVSKYQAEVGLKKIAEKTGMELVIIRPPLIYGYNAPGNFGRLIELANKNFPLPLGLINNKRSFISIQNLVDFIDICISHPKAANQIFLVSDDDDVSTSQLLKSMIVSAGKTPLLLPIPVSLLKFFAALLGKKTIIDKMSNNLQIDINHTKSTLGWEPSISFDEGIRRCFE